MVSVVAISDEESSLSSPRFIITATMILIITTQPMNFAIPCSLLATAKCRAVLQSTHRQTIETGRLIVLPGFHS